MRTMTMVIAGIAALLIVGGGLVWYENRPLGVPSAEQFKNLNGFAFVLATVDSLACPYDTLTQKKFDVAKAKVSRLRARYTLTPAQTEKLAHTVTIGGYYGTGLRRKEVCDKFGSRLADFLNRRIDSQ